MRSTILNAFQPGNAIRDSKLFAGRREQIAELVDSLHAEGTCPIIIGARGLGKTSLALQVREIAMGHDALLEQMDLTDHRIPTDETFAVLQISCSDQVNDYHDLMRRLVNAVEDLEVAATSSGKTLRDSTNRFKVSLKAFEYERINTFDQQRRAKYEDLDAEEQFLRLVQSLQRLTGQRLLIIIDELDRVKNTAGLASFVKSYTSPYMRLMLVGVAQDVSEILEDHGSLERQLISVAVPPMKHSELGEIVKRVENRLSSKGHSFMVTDRARGRLASLAAGFPWFVHVIGQEALLHAYDSSRDKVKTQDVKVAVARLSQSRFAQHFSDLYQKAVRDSVHRETVLRAFAEWTDTDIPTEPVYRVLKKRLDVANPSVSVRQLSQERYGEIFMRPPYQQRGLIRFRNEMFKTYVRISPSLYHELDDEVRDAFK